MIEKPSSAILTEVSQAKVISRGGHPWTIRDYHTRNGIAHTIHIVFIPKYRRKVMYGELRNDIREIIKKLCEYKEVPIVEGSVCADHIHLCVKIPPKLSVSEFTGYLKGKSALMIFDRYPEYRNKGNRHFWAKGSLCQYGRQKRS